MNVPRKSVSARHVHKNQPRSYDEVLGLESREVPGFIRHFGVKDLGPKQIPIRWYLDRRIHELEVEHIWKKTWQMACRVDDIPVVGDTHVYEIAGLSFIIVRVKPDLIKGYWNACLHRGLALRRCSGRVDRLQCPFHGFTWALDGKSVFIPGADEFPEIDPRKFSLPEIQVAEWEGFIFVNPDPGAEPLEQYLGEFAGQFSRWPYRHRHKAIHFAKRFPANWKVVQEAFMEAWHVLVTHPQLAWSAAADHCAQYLAGGNFSRGVLTNGLTSPYLARTPDEQEIWDKLNRVWDDESRPAALVLPPGMTARQALIATHRDALRPILGEEAVAAFCDTEVVDLFYWTLFPNFHPFAGFNYPFMYRFYPDGDDPASSVMEVMFLVPLPPGAPVPPPAPLAWVGENEDFTALEELGSFGAFISQDIANMGVIMKGLRNNQNGYVNLAREQELKIRHFYAVYEKALGVSAADEIAALGAARGAAQPSGAAPRD